MVRYTNPLSRRHYVRSSHLNSACDSLGFSANLVSPILTKPEDYLSHTAVSQFLVGRRYTYRSNLQNGYDLWAGNCVTEYFTPPPEWPVPGDEDYDEDDHKAAAEEPIDDSDRKTVSALSYRGAHKRFYRRNGGIYSEPFPGRLAEAREDRIDVTVMSLDRSGKNAMLVQKYSRERAGMVDIAIMIDIPGPGSEAWTKEGGGGWWGTARETEKLLAVTCRLRMQGQGNGLGVIFGLVTGGTRVRFFKWTDDKKEKIGGRFEDLAVLLGLTDDEEDPDSSSDDDGEMPDVPEQYPTMNGHIDEDESGPSSAPTGKGKGKAKAVEEDEATEEQDPSPSAAGPPAQPPPHHTSLAFTPDPEDLFDIRLPPETARGGYYDMLWQGEKCKIMFHHIGGYDVD
ncbi:hypothetical protein TWF696_006537 [Orbilia brochopaga]|uniref:Uncharacterized protein n=1 Tax=Orbilia brochopaga TaxID=3140254 RepID=A0AAV9UZD4_9PEZI